MKTQINIKDFAEFIINEVVEETDGITEAEAVSDILNDAEHFIDRLEKKNHLSRQDARRVVECIRKIQDNH